jgi:3-oxoacyl-[acyl-carrier-protein] synthase II
MSRSAKIGISGWGSVSALGIRPAEIWRAYREPGHRMHALGEGPLVSSLPPAVESKIHALRHSDKRYGSLDRSVHLAMMAAESAVNMANWTGMENFGINIGSSRGATQIWEDYHATYLGTKGRVSPLTSPTTTLGNIASWVGYHVGGSGPALSHSITCSTALHALLNGISWLEAGRSDRFLVGGSEAPLTDFTISQMKALRIYARDEAVREDYPCRAGDPGKRENSMVLGEGASCFCLERGPRRPLAIIEGMGYGTERISTATGLSREGHCLQRAMRMALEEAGHPAIDVIVTHTPGTILGDRVEAYAIEAVFQGKIPFLTNNKWKIGHTLGASGGLSLEMALLMLQHDQLVEVPYLSGDPANRPRRIMVNALGFGGNAVSVVLGRATD